MKERAAADEFTFLDSDLNDADMYAGIKWDSTIYEDQTTKDGVVIISDEQERLVYYDHFVQCVLTKKKPHITFVDRGNGKIITLGSMVSDVYYSLIFEEIDIPRGNVRFSENVELFLECHAALKLPLPSRESPDALIPWSMDALGDLYPEGTRHGDVFNRLVDLIREGAQQPAFMKRVRERIRSSQENYQSGIKYVAKLFANTSRLLVLRIDVHYAKKFAKGVPVTQIRKDFVRFMNNRRHNGLFASMVGHIWKLEEGQSRGFHLHLILFFRGSKVYQHAYLAEEIGQYWENAITKGQGTYFSCHRNPNRYRRSGIGMIHCTDREKLATLNTIIRYITKKDQYLRIKEGRTFGHGIAPTFGSSPKRGRPRTKNMVVDVVVGSSPRAANEEDQVKSSQSHDTPKGVPDLA